MKKGALLLSILLFLLFVPFPGIGQDCTILSKANSILPDKLCRPVMVEWTVSYVGVNDNGTSVEILYNWDDGSQETVAATEINAGTSEWEAIATHTYSINDNKCNYSPVATLVVNGVVCTSSSQEQIVTVWDDDDHNGGFVNPSPDVYPICFGNGATMRFDDDTRFNCVPPQENDQPNLGTRWIQWIYGTNITMSGSPVMVDGVVQAYPFAGPVIKLPGPVTGSNQQSLPITVADDHQIGEFFEVELRYWNYCNPYEPAPPEPYVSDRSRILIVGNPDPTITPVAPLCEYDNNILLTAATGGGIWSGNGIVDDVTGEFSPAQAGPGTHEISYTVTDGNSCSAEDTLLIEIHDAPEGTITPISPLCIYDAPYDLEASTTQGTWSGPGITDPATGIFDPAVAGLGSHEVVFTTDPDPSGCIGSDTTTIYVMDIPFAEFITPDSSWCMQSVNSSIGRVVFTGTDSSTFDLMYQQNGIMVTLTGLPNDTFNLVLNNQEGVNEYILFKVIEHHGGNSCETDLADTLTMTVHSIPEASINLSYDDPCSPVIVQFGSDTGLARYIWNFGEGNVVTTSSQIERTFTFDYLDNMTIVGDDTIYDLTRDDSLYVVQLRVETEFGCTDSITDSVRVYPVPVADFFVMPVTQEYPDTIVTLTNLTSVGNWSYLWDFGDGTRDTAKEAGQHNYFEFGIFDIGLQAFSEFCLDSISRRIQIFPPPPVAGFEPDTVGCPPLLVKFRNRSRYAHSYIWDFDDGFFSTDANPSHIFYESGVHQVKMLAIGLSGQDSTIMEVMVYEPPQSHFDVYPSRSSNLEQLFKFSNKSTNAVGYLWDFGDGDLSSVFEPEHTYGVAGTYSVTLVAVSQENCTDTLVREDLVTVVAGEGSIEFPTAFVWNGSGPSGGNWETLNPDDINTIFHPLAVNAVKFRMVIYTRWGEAIFESNDVKVGWDGYMANGELAGEGVYFWRAWITYVDGEEVVKRGDVTFLH